MTMNYRPFKRILYLTRRITHVGILNCLSYCSSLKK